MTQNPVTSFQGMAIGEPGWLVPSQVYQEEELDLGKGTPADVAENLTEMWRMNRYLKQHDLQAHAAGVIHETVELRGRH